AKVVEDDQVQGRQAESQAEIYKTNLDHASKVLSIQEDEPAEVQEQKAKEDPTVQREDFESLWNLVKEMFSTSKPKIFSDDFLLNTLGAMFEKPNGQAQV
nr:hypothetical protein [Tanacetum cinerariifolium]